MYDYTDTQNLFQGSMAEAPVLAAIIALGIIALFFAILLYVYFAVAWMRIAEKKGHKRPWLAWIPFANIAMWLQLGRFHWAWIFLIFIPIAGWLALYILFIISNWRVFEDLKYPGWLSLAILLDILTAGTGIIGVGTIAYAVVVGIVAWKKEEKKTLIKRKKKR